jgi:hypothetical protein
MEGRRKALAGFDESLSEIDGHSPVACRHAMVVEGTMSYGLPQER